MYEGDTLAHYGVKGMKWGKRKKYTESRRDYKKRIKKEEASYYQDKAFFLASRAAIGKDGVILNTKFGGDVHRSIVTGEQFYQQLARGRAFDVKSTQIQGIRDSKGEQYVRAALYPDYKKTERR